MTKVTKINFSEYMLKGIRNKISADLLYGQYNFSNSITQLSDTYILGNSLR